MLLEMASRIAIDFKGFPAMITLAALTLTAQEQKPWRLEEEKKSYLGARNKKTPFSFSL